MATTTKSRASLRPGRLGLSGVIMRGAAPGAPAFSLLFAAGLIVSLAQFVSICPSAGTLIAYITRSIGAAGRRAERPLCR
jgi:hypothetical protein